MLNISLSVFQPLVFSLLRVLCLGLDHIHLLDYSFFDYQFLDLFVYFGEQSVVRKTACFFPDCTAAQTRINHTETISFAKAVWPIA